MYIHLEHNEHTDPRVLRTRELLINSFAKLAVEQRSIRKVSVQDVTKLAGVNRVTFYAHFKDKFELLDVWARLMFQQYVAEHLPDEPSFTAENLRLLILHTLDFFVARNNHKRRINESFEPIFDAAIQQELQTVLASMLERSTTADQIVSTETLATFLSWALFGSIVAQSHTQDIAANASFVDSMMTLCTAIVAERSTPTDTISVPLPLA